MQFTHRYVMPDHYHTANLRDDAKTITSLIQLDEDDPIDMECTADMGELVFSGSCKVEEFIRLYRLMDELIYHVTDERGE